MIKDTGKLVSVGKLANLTVGSSPEVYAIVPLIAWSNFLAALRALGGSSMEFPDRN